MTFYRLTDPVRAGDVVRAEGRKHYIYSFGPYRWVRTTIMMAYMNPDSPLYGEYEEISAEEAQRLVIEKGKQLAVLLPKAEQLAAKCFAGRIDEDGIVHTQHLQEVVRLLEDQEQKIAAWLEDICTCPGITPAYLRSEGFSPRILQAVELLTPTEEDFYDQLRRIRGNAIARAVKTADLECRCNLNRYTQTEPGLEERLAQYRKGLSYLQMEGELPQKAGSQENRFQPSLKVFGEVSRNALQGRKAPHGISNPVLRKEDGKLYLAFFVYLYQKKDLDEQKMPRPSMWILADVETGAIVRRIACTEKDFSTAAPNARYSMEYPDRPAYTKEDFQKLYRRLDTVRQAYLKDGTVNEAAYRAYYSAMILLVPPEYRVFYEELSVL